MALQHKKSWSDWFFILSYSVLGALLFVSLVVNIGLSNQDLIWIALQYAVFFGILAVNVLLGIRYEMQTFYKRPEDKTPEEKKINQSKTKKANIATAIFCGPIIAIMLLELCNIINPVLPSRVYFTLLAIAISPAIIIRYYKKE